MIPYNIKRVVVGQSIPEHQIKNEIRPVFCPICGEEKKNAEITNCELCGASFEAS